MIIKYSVIGALLGLALVGGATCLAFAHDLRNARARITGRSETVPTPSGSVEYAIAGEGAPILVIHGSAGGFDQGLDMTLHAVEQGFQLVVPSRFGYLRSTMPANADPSTQADTFVDLLDQLGLQKVAVVAISAGVWSALEFAVRYPGRCRALVLLAPAKALPSGVSNYGAPLVRALFGSDFLTWSASKVMRLAPSALAEMMFGTPAAVVGSASAEEKSRLQSLFDHLLPIGRRSAGIMFDIETAAAPIPVSLEKITCPVLAIAANDDRFDTAARARSIIAAVPNGEIVIFANGGHALVGRQAETLNAIVTFLNRWR